MVAVADARDRGEDDAAPVNREHAAAELDAARHDLEVGGVAVAPRPAALVAAVEDNAHAWAQAVSQARRKADAKARRALDHLRAAEAERAELRAATRWLAMLVDGAGFDRLARKGSVASATTDVGDSRTRGRQLTATELVDALAAYVDDTTEEAEAQRAAEAEDERGSKRHLPPRRESGRTCGRRSGTNAHRFRPASYRATGHAWTSRCGI